MGYMFAPLKRFFDFSGRSRRMEYWMYAILVTVVAVLVFGVLGAMIGASASEDGQPSGGMVGLSAVLYLVFFVVFIIPAIALQVRRMHDQDRSGWWILVPLVNFIFPAFIPGTVGPNRFGPDPKQMPVV